MKTTKFITITVPHTHTHTQLQNIKDRIHREIKMTLFWPKFLNRILSSFINDNDKPSQSVGMITIIINLKQMAY